GREGARRIAGLRRRDGCPRRKPCFCRPHGRSAARNSAATARQPRPARLGFEGMAPTPATGGPGNACGRPGTSGARGLGAFRSSSLYFEPTTVGSLLRAVAADRHAAPSTGVAPRVIGEEQRTPRAFAGLQVGKVLGPDSPHRLPPPRATSSPDARARGTGAWSPPGEGSRGRGGHRHSP